VSAGDLPFGLDEGFDDHELAVRLCRRPVEAQALSRDGVLDHVSCMNHGGTPSE
jgi:hypothetical protein